MQRRHYAAPENKKLISAFGVTFVTFTTMHKHTTFGTLVVLFIFVTRITVHVWRDLLFFTPKLCQLCTHLLSPSWSEQLGLPLSFVTLRSFFRRRAFSTLTVFEPVDVGRLLLATSAASLVLSIFFNRANKYVSLYVLCIHNYPAFYVIFMHNLKGPLFFVCRCPCPSVV